MKSEKRLVCPVTGQRARPVPLSAEEEGVFVILDEEEEDVLEDHPAGWGALTLRVVVPNPYIAEVKARREEERADATRQLHALATDESVPPAQRKLLQDGLDSGKAMQETEAAIDEKYPLPENEYVTARLSYPVLGPEALGVLLQKLKEAGFSITMPEGAS